MNNSRRDFLKKLPLAMSIPFTIGGIPIKVMGDNSLSRLAKAAGDTPRVLVILQMAGGNDGLNNLIPIEKYDEYYSKRPNIAIPTQNKTRGFIPLDSTLASNAQVGLHPDMQAMKALYDIGRMTVVQGVSYKNNDGSHFRGRDIAFMGGSANDYIQSGWLGRYLQGEYASGNPAPNDFYQYPQDFLNPAVPDNTMVDPLALEFGSDLSLIFHQNGNIPTSISIDNPESFAQLVNELEGFVEMEGVDPFGIPPDYLAGSPYYKELQWILDLEDKSKDYATRLLQLYQEGGAGTASYPETYPFNAPSGSKRNGLAPQLKLVARLLDGQVKLTGEVQTKVFLVKMGGYDTHVDQVESYDPTMGGHAALLYHMSTAMKAFQEDLRARGLEDCVLTVTTSEFGRRVYSNGSYGTDHGTGGPLYIFGKGVQPGVVGTVPDLTEANVGMQYDYRVVYANIMRDWMGITDDVRMNTIFPNTDLPGTGIMSPQGTSDGVIFEPLPLANQVITSVESFIGDRFALEDCFPNPAKDKTTMHFKVNSSYQVNINLFDSQGRKSKTLVDGVFPPGEHKVEIDLSDLTAGTYIYEMKTGFYKEAKKLIIQKR
ncbi:MAG TPA: DUF1501 domain-containing protein [Chryseolinea sp.]|nr:DUF1501 domain-containing protein [Chryseolinea sp.]